MERTDSPHQGPKLVVRIQGDEGDSLVDNLPYSQSADPRTPRPWLCLGKNIPVVVCLSVLIIVATFRVEMPVESAYMMEENIEAEQQANIEDDYWEGQKNLKQTKIRIGQLKSSTQPFESEKQENEVEGSQSQRINSANRERIMKQQNPVNKQNNANINDIDEELPQNSFSKPQSLANAEIIKPNKEQQQDIIESSKQQKQGVSHSQQADQKFMNIFSDLTQPAGVMNFNLTKIPEYDFYVRDFQDYYSRLNITTFLIVTSSTNHSLNIQSRQVLEDRPDIHEWAHFQNPSNLSTNIKQYASEVKRGLTLVWLGEGKKQFVKEWIEPREEIITQFEEEGLFYNKLASMKMRVASNNNLVIFTREKPHKNSKFRTKPHSEGFLALHTVFRMEENLAHMREWIGYHIYQGADYIVLYDNYESMGSKGSVGNKGLFLSTQKQTKYHIPISCFGQTEQSILTQFNELWEDYQDYIIYIPWQPRNTRGHIFYGQAESVIHYQHFFEDMSTTTAFLDMDEFLFSPKDNNIEQFMRLQMKKGYTKLRIMQHKFGNRFCYGYMRATDIHEVYRVTSYDYSPKLLVVNAALRAGSSIHDLTTKYGRMQKPPVDEIRLNHYNGLLSWIEYSLANNFSTSQHFEHDSSMNRYKDVIDEICSGGKCSQSYALSCFPNSSDCPSKIQIEEQEPITDGNK